MSKRLRVVTHVVRVLLGMLFVFSGLDGLFSLSAPPELPSSAASLLAAMTATGYMMPLLKTVELVAGAMLVSNRFVPLALTALAPVVANVAAFHIVLAPILPLALFLLAAESYLVWVHREVFLHLLHGASGRPADPKPAQRGDEHAPAGDGVARRFSSSPRLSPDGR